MSEERSLVKKLAEVMGAVGWIQKTGYNEFHKYKYAQEADLVNAIRGELSKRSVMVFPNVITCERKPHEVETMKWDDAARAKVPTIRKTQLTEIVVEWTFVDGESGEERKLLIPGVGEDNVDKGFYKAFTGSEKYALMKTFLIPTGDDPEKDSDDERETAKQSGKVAAADVAQQKIAKLKAAKEETNGNDYVPSLFYTWHDESQTAEISGAETLKTLHKPYLKQYWSPSARALVVNAEQLENMKYELEKRGVPFHPLKAM